MVCVNCCRCTSCFAPRPTDPFARFCSECGGAIAPLPQSRIPPPAAGQVSLSSAEYVTCLLTMMTCDNMFTDTPHLAESIYVSGWCQPVCLFICLFCIVFLTFFGCSSYATYAIPRVAYWRQ